jgi:hypothetical protein
VPDGVRPRPNVCLVFAPRERCYKHSLTDPSCRRNARHRNLLLAQVEHFRAAGAAPPRVLEYWFDAIRFPGGVPDLTAPMADDLRFYRGAGVDTVQILATATVARRPRTQTRPPSHASPGTRRARRRPNGGYAGFAAYRRPARPMRPSRRRRAPPCGTARWACCPPAATAIRSAHVPKHRRWA